MTVCFCHVNVRSRPTSIAQYRMVAWYSGKPSLAYCLLVSPPQTGQNIATLVCKYIGTGSVQNSRSLFVIMLSAWNKMFGLPF